MGVKIRDLDTGNIDDLVSVCVSQSHLRQAETLAEGNLRKKRWIGKALAAFGSCAKIAYVDNEPAGFDRSIVSWSSIQSRCSRS